MSGRRRQLGLQHSLDTATDLFREARRTNIPVDRLLIAYGTVNRLAEVFQRDAESA